MKYLIIENREQEQNELLYDIADFLWDNENEVFIRRDKNNTIDYQNIAKYCDCIALLIYSDCSTESLFERVQETLHKDLNFEKRHNKKIMLVFSKNGVYSNAFPFPHKIFHFEKLDQIELARFFNWCRKLNLFVKTS